MDEIREMLQSGFNTALRKQAEDPGWLQAGLDKVSPYAQQAMDYAQGPMVNDISQGAQRLAPGLIGGGLLDGLHGYLTSDDDDDTSQKTLLNALLGAGLGGFAQDRYQQMGQGVAGAANRAGAAEGRVGATENRLDMMDKTQIEAQHAKNLAELQASGERARKATPWWMKP